MTNKKFIKDFLTQIENTLLLDEADKNYWRENVEKLPEIMLQYFSGLLNGKDELVNSYMEKALMEDPGIANILKDKVQKIRKNIMAMEEDEADDKGHLEDMLNNELKKI